MELTCRGPSQALSLKHNPLAISLETSLWVTKRTGPHLSCLLEEWLRRVKGKKDELLEGLNIGRRPRLLEAAAGSPTGTGRRKGHRAPQEERKQSQVKPYQDVSLTFLSSPSFEILLDSLNSLPLENASLKLRRKLALHLIFSKRVIHLSRLHGDHLTDPRLDGSAGRNQYPVRLSIHAKNRQSQQQGQGHSVTWIVFAGSHSDSQFHWLLSPVFFF